LAGSHLQLYPGASGATAVASNTDMQLVLTRDGASGVTRLYLNGALEQTYTGVPSSAAVPSGNVLTFFEDDVTTGTETASGSVDWIAAYNRVLSAADLAPSTNHAPTVTADQPSVRVGEGQTAVAHGTWQDADHDPVTLSASVGTVTTNANGTWSWSFATSDGPDQSQTVVITATDSAGATATASFNLIVDNIAPTVRTGSSTGPAPDHFYGLDGSLADQMGGPVLTDDGGVLGSGSYTFSANHGLRLTGALADPATYSILLSLNIDTH